jgi:hypothetical protein
VTKRSKFLIGVLLGLAIGVGAVAYAVWTALYDHIMTTSETLHIDVQEINGTHPLQLKIAVQTAESAPVIRTVTARQRGQSVTILYHLALSGLVKPGLGWSEPYVLTVPDSVSEVRFGRESEVIWRRSITAQ